MFVVVKLGGCNGSGKTSVARALMEHVGGMKPRSSVHTKKDPDHYVQPYSNVEVVVLGNYDNTCGGMDTISDKEERLALLRASCKPGRIIFYEGLITGKTYGAMGALSEEHIRKKRGRWLYAFMDTPFDVCVQRVMFRRAVARNENPFDPERTMRPTFDSCTSLAAKLKQEKVGRGGPLHPHPVHMIDHALKSSTAARQLLTRALEVYREGPTT